MQVLNKYKITWSAVSFDRLVSKVIPPDIEKKFHDTIIIMSSTHNTSDFRRAAREIKAFFKAAGMPERSLQVEIRNPLSIMATTIAALPNDNQLIRRIE